MRHIGMDKDELLRLKQITGLTSLFQDQEFSTAWNDKKQLKQGIGDAANECDVMEEV